MNDKQRIIEDLEDLKYLLQKPKNIVIARMMIDSMMSYLTTSQQVDTPPYEFNQDPLTLAEQKELQGLNEHFRTAPNLYISDKQIARARFLVERLKRHTNE